MKVTFVLVLVCLNVVLSTEQDNFTVSEEENSKLLSRRRRYIVFPRGSSLQLVFCNTYKFPSPLRLYFGSTVSLAWRLPDDPMIYSEHKKKHKIYKRDVFKKLETIMRHDGSSGQQCVLKALCESGQRTPSKKEFIFEILHAVFSFPSDDDDDDDDSEDTHEDKLYRKAHSSVNQNCDKLYPDCKMSIFKSIQ